MAFPNCSRRVWECRCPEANASGELFGEPPSLTEMSKSSPSIWMRARCQEIRRSPSGRRFFWDGRAASLEEQVLKPIEDPHEMDLSLPEAAVRVGLAPDKVSRALASFVRSILSGDSRFDRFVKRRSRRAHGGRAGRLAVCSEEGPTASRATPGRISRMSGCTTLVSPGAAANSPTPEPGEAISKHLPCARSPALRPTCTTVASPLSKTSSSITTAAATGIRIRC
jgi:hypothetical protein